MSIAQTSSGRSPHDLSHLVFSAGQVGKLQTISSVPVIAGDSYQQNLNAAVKLSPMRRGLIMDSVIEVFSFYVPHRHVYGDEWNQFIMDGINSEPLGSPVDVNTLEGHKLAHLGMNGRQDGTPNHTTQIPKWAKEGYDLIYNNYFKYPEEADWNLSMDNMTDEQGMFGYECSLKNAPFTQRLPEQGTSRELNIPSDGETATINVQELNQQYGELHTEEERELFGQRYRDVISNMGGSTHYDADNRPRLLGRTEQWASGYDVDGTDETSLGSHVGRVNQDISHNVNRFFVPEHGTVWTVMLVRFPSVHQQEANYLHKTPMPSYDEIAGDPAIIANHPRIRPTQDKFFFGAHTTSGEMGDYAHSYWYRQHCNLVHPLYDELEGYPFLGHDGEIDYTIDTNPFPKVQAETYDRVFQTTQLAHWNMQARNNVSVMRAIPTTRDSIVTSN